MSVWARALCGSFVLRVHLGEGSTAWSVLNSDFFPLFLGFLSFSLGGCWWVAGGSRFFIWSLGIDSVFSFTRGCSLSLTLRACSFFWTLCGSLWDSLRGGWSLPPVSFFPASQEKGALGTEAVSTAWAYFLARGVGFHRLFPSRLPSLFSALLGEEGQDRRKSSCVLPAQFLQLETGPSWPLAPGPFLLSSLPLSWGLGVFGGK